MLHSSPSLLQDLVDDFERSQILAALEATAWNTSRAAGHLGVARNTLRYRMKKLRLQRPGPPRCRLGWLGQPMSASPWAVNGAGRGLEQTRAVGDVPCRTAASTRGWRADHEASDVSRSRRTESQVPCSCRAGGRLAEVPTACPPGRAPGKLAGCVNRSCERRHLTHRLPPPTASADFGGSARDLETGTGPDVKPAGLRPSASLAESLHLHGGGRGSEAQALGLRQTLGIVPACGSGFPDVS